MCVLHTNVKKSSSLLLDSCADSRYAVGHQCWLFCLLSAVEFDALPDDTAKLEALGNFRGAFMTIKIRKTVKFPFTSYVLADAQVLFIQKDMGNSTINDEVQIVMGTDRGKGDSYSGRTN